MPFVLQEYSLEVAAVDEGSAPFAFVTRITEVVVFDELGLPVKPVSNKGADFSFVGGRGMATSKETGEGKGHGEGRSRAMLSAGVSYVAAENMPSPGEGRGSGCLLLSLSRARVLTSLLRCS